MYISFAWRFFVTFAVKYGSAVLVAPPIEIY